MALEFSNFLPGGTTHRDIPSTCPAQYRDRIANLRSAVAAGASWLEKELDRCARVAREIALSDANANKQQVERPVVRQRKALSVETQPKLLKVAKLRQEIFEAEVRYGTDPYMIGDLDYEEIFDGDQEFDSAKHIAAASYHMEQAEGLEGNDEQHDLDQYNIDKASAHYKAAAAHLKAANVLGSKDASMNSKDAATKAAKKASKLALADIS